LASLADACLQIGRRRASVCLQAGGDSIEFISINRLSPQRIGRNSRAVTTNRACSGPDGSRMRRPSLHASFQNVPSHKIAIAPAVPVKSDEAVLVSLLTTPSPALRRGNRRRSFQRDNHALRVLRRVHFRWAVDGSVLQSAPVNAQSQRGRLATRPSSRAYE
jgi:hypothetical protein